MKADGSLVSSPRAPFQGFQDGDGSHPRPFLSPCTLQVQEAVAALGGRLLGAPLPPSHRLLALDERGRAVGVTAGTSIAQLRRAAALRVTMPAARAGHGGRAAASGDEAASALVENSFEESDTDYQI